MSRENLEIARAIYAASATGDLFAILPMLDADVVYVRRASGATGGLDLSGEWRGRDATIEAAGQWALTFERLRVEAEEFREAGDSVLVLTRQIGRTRGGGVPVEAEFADVLTFRDGRVVRVEQYRDRTEAIEAFGLRE